MRHAVLTVMLAGLAAHAAPSPSTKNNAPSVKTDGIPVASEAATKAAAFPNGTVYFTKKTAKHVDLFSMNADGSGVKQWTTFEDWVECRDIKVNANSSHVVFTYREKMSNGLGVVDLKTGKTKVLIKPSFKETTNGCALSPNGKTIAVIAGESFENHLYVMSVTGSQKKQFTKIKGYKQHPVWSPNGKVITFDCAPPEKLEGGGASYNFPDVMGVRSTGGKCVNLTPKAKGKCRDAEISRDGKRVVYVHDGIKSQEKNLTLMAHSAIWTMAVNGKGKKQLTDDKAGDTEPTWSPDGKKIAFISTRGGGYANVFVMNADGSDMKQLTKQDYSKKMMPRWSENGKFIFYVQEKSWKRKGFVVSVETGETRQLLSDCNEFIMVEKK